METKVDMIEFDGELINVEVTFNLIEGHDAILDGHPDDREPACADYLEVIEISKGLVGGEWEDATEDYEFDSDFKAAIDDVIYS